MPSSKLLLLTALLLPGFLFAQIDSLPNTAFGSAKELKGSTHIVNFFVSAGRRKWDKDEKQLILDMQNNGIAWLKVQAAKWKIEELNFRRSNIGLEKDILLDKIESDKEPSNLHVNWVPYVLHAAGYASVRDFYDSVKAANQADNVVVMIFACHEGRSYAQPAFSDDKNAPRFLEGAVVYREDFYNDALHQGTIIHEMLHLFGAWDMYHSETRSPELDKKINDIFSSSIMLDSHQLNMNDYKMDQLTAWLVGWTKRYWPYFEIFRQANRQYWKVIPGIKEYH